MIQEDYDKFSVNFDMINWKKSFDTEKSKDELDWMLAQVRKELLALSETMTKLMAEEEHITIQLKLKAKERGDA